MPLAGQSITPLPPLHAFLVPWSFARAGSMDHHLQLLSKMASIKPKFKLHLRDVSMYCGLTLQTEAVAATFKHSQCN